MPRPMTSQRGQNLLERAGAFFLAAGFAARFLMIDDLELHAVAESTGIGLLLLGSGLVLLACVARGGAAAGALVLLLPFVLAWAARGREPLAVKRAIDVWTACSAGLAIRELVRARGMGAPVRAALAASAVVLGLFGIAQTLYLRREAAELAHEMTHVLSISDLGRAFLESRRAAATFMSANAFAGFLLLAGVPVVFAAVSTFRSGAPPRAKLRAGVLAAVVVAAFSCAGSAGGTLAGVAGVLLACALASSGRTRALLLAALSAVALASAGLVAAAAAASSASGKLKTLQERIDYHTVGMRLLRATWPEGAGLEQTRFNTKYLTEGFEAFSRSLHDWWLQGLVEGGVAFLPVAAALVWAIARGARAATRSRGAAPAPAADPALARSWWRGLAFGTVLALVLEPFVTVVSYGLPTPVHTLVMIGAAVLAGLAVRRVDWLQRPVTVGLAAGCAGFALHGFVDFDLYIAGVMLAFATSLALLTAEADGLAPPRPPSAFARALTAVYSVVGIIAPIGVILLAETREHVH